MHTVLQHLCLLGKLQQIDCLDFGTDGKRKRAPIPVFVPRQKRAALEANGDKSKGSDAADAPEREAKLARTESNDKRSVFERLKSGSGKVRTFSHWLQCLICIVQWLVLTRVLCFAWSEAGMLLGLSIIPTDMNLAASSALLAGVSHDIQKKLFSFQRQNVKVEGLKFLFLCNL